MAQNVLSISEINEYIRNMLDRDGFLTGIAVKGEISNYKVYPSGHHYFTLKDEGAALKCVMFRNSAVRLKFKPDNGMQVIAMGKISVYPRDGIYQLYCSTLVLDGIGDLHAAFEQLKTKLSTQGLFDSVHKKRLPLYPGVIGIVTSSAGAAIHDMLRILNKRYPLTKVRLFPVRVQGAEAPGEIAAAIRYANRYNLADVLIVGRGGGSIEDLWAFNEEIVAREIFSSTIPIISAVGHEPDVTISDYVADLRAATPSNAAELAVPDSDSLRQQLDAFSTTMMNIVLRQIKNAKQHLNILKDSQALQSPIQYISHRRNALALLESDLRSTQQRCINLKKQEFISLTSKLDAMSPLKVLTRGYTIMRTKQGDVVRSINQLIPGDSAEVILQDGYASVTVEDVKEETL